MFMILMKRYEGQHGEDGVRWTEYLRRTPYHSKVVARLDVSLFRGYRLSQSPNLAVLDAGDSGHLQRMYYFFCRYCFPCVADHIGTPLKIHQSHPLVGRRYQS